MSNVSHQDCRVAVVILNWNGRDHLERYLPSVLEHTLQDAEVWVADNGSTDDSLAWLESNHPEVKTLALGRNWGFAEGNGAVPRGCRRPCALELGRPHCVALGCASLEGHGRTRMVGRQPPLGSVEASTLVRHGWTKTGFRFAWGVFLMRSRGRVHQQNREVFWASGAALFVLKSAWVEAGGLDGALFAHIRR